MAAATALRNIVKSLAEVKTFDRCYRHLNIVSAGEGKIKCQLTMDKEHVSMYGFVHGGMTATLIDVVSSYALATVEDAKFGVSVDLNLSYLSNPKEGDQLTITSEVLKRGRTLAFATAEIRDQNGKLIASGRHTKYMAMAGVI